MVTLPDASWRHRAGLADLVALLGGGDVTRLVGGAVRDGLLGLAVSDIDLATQLTPDDVLERLRAAGVRAVPTGLAHGTVTAVTPGGPVEVTTLRRDVATDGRHATVAFGTDWRGDAARRDFTINAIYADPVSGAVFDWFDGIADLGARHVRFIGDAATRIAEDHLRILRFFRFHARFGTGAPDAAGYAACVARANDLMALSRERIAGELLKLLGGANPVDAVAAMLAGNILRPVLPEIVAADALARLVAREAAFAVTPDPLRRLAALLPADRPVVEAVAARLRLSKAQAKRLAIAAERACEAPRVLAYRLGQEAAIDALLLGDGDRVALGEIAAFSRPVLPIKGGGLIARGVPPGPAVARMLIAIEAEWIAADFPDGVAFAALVDTHLQAL